MDGEPIDLSSEDEAVPARSQHPSVIDLTLDDDDDLEELPAPPPVLATGTLGATRSLETEGPMEIESDPAEQEITRTVPPVRLNDGAAVEALPNATPNTNNERRKRSLNGSISAFSTVSPLPGQTSGLGPTNPSVNFNEPGFIAAKRLSGIINRKAPLSIKASTAPRLSSLKSNKSLNAAKQTSVPKNTNLVKRIANTSLQNLIPDVPAMNKVEAPRLRRTSPERLDAATTLNDEPSPLSSEIVAEEIPVDGPPSPSEQVPEERTEDPDLIADQTSQTIAQPSPRIPTVGASSSSAYDIEKASLGAGSTSRAAEGWYDRVPHAGWASRPATQHTSDPPTATLSLPQPILPRAPPPEPPKSSPARKKKKKKISLASKETETFSGNWEHATPRKRKRSKLDKDMVGGTPKKHKRKHHGVDYIGMEGNGDDELLAHLNTIQSEISARTIKQSEPLPVPEAPDASAYVSDAAPEEHIPEGSPASGNAEHPDSQPQLDIGESEESEGVFKMITADSPSDGGDDLEQSTEIQRLLQDQLDAEGVAALQAALTQSLVDNATVVDSSLQRADSNDNLIRDTDVELQAALLRSTAPDSVLEDEDLALQFALLYSTDPTYAEMDIEMQTTLMDSAQPVSPAGEVAATAQTELDLASGSLSDDVQMTSSLNHDRSPVAVVVNSPGPGEDLDHGRDPSPVLEPLPEIDSNTAPEVNSAGSRPTSPAHSSVMPVALSQYGLVDRAEQMRRQILDANSDVASVIPFFDGGYHNPGISPPFAPWMILAPFLSKKFDIERGRGAETPAADRANTI